MGLVIVAVGSTKLADSEGAALGHIGKLIVVGLHVVPPEARAGCIYICVAMANARIIVVKTLQILRGLNIERKLLTGYEILDYGKICVRYIDANAYEKLTKQLSYKASI
ncbi:ATP/GTP-binding protein [Nostoc cycadae WK-1]|uniref:ATP/GTP-binding protein n=1 Tax=Nostoc cycadae WK-1 TaxID=1861711 RepID=A0A2H6LHK9_9NOSO|nr:ATP/GTP-binding protein [Nostoc cycadae WK-1]